MVHYRSLSNHYDKLPPHTHLSNTLYISQSPFFFSGRNSRRLQVETPKVGGQRACPLMARLAHLSQWMHFIYSRRGRPVPSDEGYVSYIASNRERHRERSRVLTRFKVGAQVVMTVLPRAHPSQPQHNETLIENDTTDVLLYICI